MSPKPEQEVRARLEIKVPDSDPYKTKSYNPQMERWKNSVVKNGVCSTCANGGLGCRHICYMAPISWCRYYVPSGFDFTALSQVLGGGGG